MRPGGLLIAAAVVVITNGVVLMEVARNRAGAPVETIQLTERELPLNSRQNEDSGLSARLNWRPFGAFPGVFSWLDQTKLEGLGFNYSKAMRDPQHAPLARQAFIVLEYDGAAWEHLKSASPPTQPDLTSRLIPIDAASRSEPLLRKYPDRDRYLIVKGIVQFLITTTSKGQPQLQPFISEVLPESIHVPPPLSDALGRFPGNTNPASPRYTLTLSYGRSFEPWIVSIGEPGKN